MFLSQWLRTRPVSQLRQGKRRAPAEVERATVPSGDGEPYTGPVLARSSSPLGWRRLSLSQMSRRATYRLGVRLVVTLARPVDLSK